MALINSLLFLFVTILFVVTNCKHEKRLKELEEYVFAVKRQTKEKEN